MKISWTLRKPKLVLLNPLYQISKNIVMSNWSFIIVFFNQMRMLAFSCVNCEKNIACHANSYVIVLEII